MNSVVRDTRWLEILFVLLAILGLIGTSAQLPAYLHLGPVNGTIQFWTEALSSPASMFLAVDILMLGAVVLVWMFGECRRLGIAAGWAWVYFAGSLLIGISFFVPLFMAHRQRCIRIRLPDQQSSPVGSDFLAVAIALAAAVASSAYSLTHIPFVSP
ncbi:DUF2834 domain-containing protein [Solimonas sp. K1W22B-7]|uniref:DUF2834 domain-containing protein n=1 Tax=Solimonas sp. K1W22B-7 TaxID=2303331 RepID=UPI0013C4D3A3|nr:DUF2834 domain-containing protein [Solimonas sp. K1W22B-7]